MTTTLRTSAVKNSPRPSLFEFNDEDNSYSSRKFANFLKFTSPVRPSAHFRKSPLQTTNSYSTPTSQSYLLKGTQSNVLGGMVSIRSPSCELEYTDKLEPTFLQSTTNNIKVLTQMEESPRKIIRELSKPNSYTGSEFHFIGSEYSLSNSTVDFSEKLSSNSSGSLFEETISTSIDARGSEDHSDINHEIKKPDEKLENPLEINTSFNASLRKMLDEAFEKKKQIDELKQAASAVHMEFTGAELSLIQLRLKLKFLKFKLEMEGSIFSDYQNFRNGLLSLLVLFIIFGLLTIIWRMTVDFRAQENPLGQLLSKLSFFNGIRYRPT